jgi:CopG family transcriptional regulator/antitoxin EndoAI
MKKAAATAHHRINITLPERTLRLIDRVAKRGDRSRFIDRAVRHFVETTVYKRLEAELEEGYRARADHDVEMAEEWFRLDEEAWQKSKR